MASRQTSERKIAEPRGGWRRGKAPRHDAARPRPPRQSRRGCRCRRPPSEPRPGHHMRCGTETRRSPTPAGNTRGGPGPHTRHHGGCTQDAAQTYSCRRPRAKAPPNWHAAQRRTCPRSVSPPATSEHASVKARHRSDLRAVAARAGASGQMQTIQAPRSHGRPATTSPRPRQPYLGGPAACRGPRGSRDPLPHRTKILGPWRPGQ